MKTQYGEERLKDTNNGVSAGKFNRQSKKAHNTIRCKKRKYQDPDFRLNRMWDMFKRVKHSRKTSR